MTSHIVRIGFAVLWVWFSCCGLQAYAANSVRLDYSISTGIDYGYKPRPSEFKCQLTDISRQTIYSNNNSVITLDNTQRGQVNIDLAHGVSSGDIDFSAARLNCLPVSSGAHDAKKGAIIELSCLTRARGTRQPPYVRFEKSGYCACRLQGYPNWSVCEKQAFLPGLLSAFSFVDAVNDALV